MLSTLSSYKHTQTIPATVWIIEHGLSTDTPVVDCWIMVEGERVRVMPKQIERIDGSTCKAVFSGETIGFAVVA